MTKASATLPSIAVSLFVVCAHHDVRAADINGVWLADVSACSKVFEKKGQTISFAKAADTYGSGFIIEDNQLRGRYATCTVTARKQQGDLVNIIAVCSTDIAIHTSQFRLRVVSENKIVREFPGMPEIEMSYERCSL